MTPVVEFFRRWGHCHLCAIPVEGGGATGKNCRTPRDILDFLAQPQRNFYFSVNPPIKPLDKKLAKGDIKHVAYIQADLDPDPEKPLAEERARLLRMAREPQHLPPPSVIIDSGGGYQVFWKLEHPVDKDDGELICQCVAALIGADACWNCDRIMRVPYTMNIPDQRKRARGRQEARSDLILAEWEQRIDADELVMSMLSDRSRALAQGQGDYPSRSERVFAFCGRAQRDGCPPKLLQRILTNPRFPISASVREKPNPTQYAQRQIERTRPSSDDNEVDEMNQKYAVIEEAGGRCRVLVDDDEFRPNYLSFEDIGKIYNNKKVDGVPAGKYWLGHEDRRQYRRVVFEPNLTPGSAVLRGEPVFNRWGGFRHEAREGDLHKPLVEHIHGNICDGNDEHFDYVWRWIARMVQKPHRPGVTALVLQGTTGIGKTFLAEVLSELLGRHALIVSNSEHLVGRFNSHLGELVMLVAEEAFFAGDKRHEGALKTLITGRTLPLERKGFDVENAPNRLHLLLTSNEDWVVPVGVADRRFAVFKVGARRRRDVAYFANIENSLKGGGYANLLHALLHTDNRGYNPLVIPETAARYAQFERTLEPDRRWWADILEAGGIPKAPDKDKPQITSEEAEAFGEFPEDGDAAQWKENPDVQELYHHFLQTAGLARRQRLPFFGDWYARWQEALPGATFNPPLNLDRCRRAFWAFVRGVGDGAQQ